MINNVVKNIKNLRELKGLTQEYVSDCVNISRATYSQIENGKIRLSVDLLYKLSEVLEMEVIDIMQFENPTSYKLGKENDEANEKKQSYLSNNKHENDNHVLLKEMVEMQRELINKLREEIAELKKR